MPKVTSLLLAGSLIIAGCAATRLEPPNPPARAMQARSSESAVRVAAEPYGDPARQRATFDRDLRRHGFLPVLLLLENAGEASILLRTESITIRFPDGAERDAAEGGAAVADVLASAPIDWNRTVGVAGGWGFGSIGFGLGYLFGEALPAKGRARSYTTWRLPDELSLGPGERARGFVYFRMPEPSPEVGTLRVRLISLDAGSIRDVVLPLRELSPPGG